MRSDNPSMSNASYYALYLVPLLLLVLIYARTRVKQQTFSYALWTRRRTAG